MERESFQSRLGFILVSAGCAIGIGNVWKFPYIAGQNGGGLFVLVYLLFLAIMGIPILTMELAIGRGSGLSIVRAYKKLEPKGSKWHIHGWFCLAGSYLLMMFYTTVSGWMLDYAWKFSTGTFDSIAPEQTDAVYADMLQNPWEMLVFLTITVLIGFLVCFGGVKNGLERVNKWMMLALLVLIVVLAVNSLFLSGTAEGLKFYLMPNFESFQKVGLLKIVSAAMSQAFFTLSVGIGSMEIFGSYMSRDNTLTGEAIRITALDTFVAVISGLIIFPACFTYNVAPTEGPSLIFAALPKIFMHMPLGRLWGSLFFIFMSFASLSTVTARKKSAAINSALMFVLSLPCLLGFNVWSGVKLFGKDILGAEDFLVSNLLLPVGALVFLFFCSYRFGWGFDSYRSEANTGRGVKIGKGMRCYFRYVLPLLILFILVTGLVPQQG